MNYPIEKLLNNDKIKCHEIRATMYGGKHLLLHFFITQPFLDNYLPQFKMGYETYSVSAKDLISDNNKPLEGLIKDYALLNADDNISSLFSYAEPTKNEWTEEQEDLMNYNNSQSVLSSHYTLMPAPSLLGDSYEDTKIHSIWNSEIHFNKFKHCSNEDIYKLLKEYKGYIDMSIPADLDTESKLNIEMETLFGASFDMMRIKNKFLHDDHEKLTEHNF